MRKPSNLVVVAPDNDDENTDEVVAPKKRDLSSFTAHHPVKMLDPKTSTTMMLAMPGSTVQQPTLNRMDSHCSLVSVDEHMTRKQDVSYSLRPLLLTFNDVSLETIFTAETKEVLKRKRQRFALVAAAVELAHLIDYSEHQSTCHSPTAKILLMVNIGFALLLGALAWLKWKKVESDDSWNCESDTRKERLADRVGQLLVLVIVVLHNIAVELMVQGYMGLQPGMILANVVLLSPCLLPVRFLEAGAFQVLAFIAFIVTHLLEDKDQCQIQRVPHAGIGATYQFLSLLILAGLGLVEAHAAERVQRVLWASRREKETLIGVHTALAKGFDNLKNKHSHRRSLGGNSEHDPTQEVMQELRVLRDDLKATGNVTAGTMIENVMRDLMAGTSSYGSKNAALLRGKDTTGGYIRLLQSRRGYDSRQSDQSKVYQHTPGQESLTSDSRQNSHSDNHSFERQSSSGTPKGRRHTTAVARSHNPKLNVPRACLPVQKQALLNIYSDLGERMADWNFGEGGVFEMPEGGAGHELMLTLHYAFVHYNVFHRLEVVPSTFHRFISAIEQLYGGVSYHNRFHAADVVHSAFWMLSQGGIDCKEKITMNTIFATLVGAAVHDVGHPGMGNTYLVNTGSEVALRFNDMHVLENMHLSIAFNVMRDEKMDILQHMEEVDRREIRSFLIDGVIATDLSLHFEKVAKLKGMVESNSVDLSESADASEIVCAIIHSADISCTAKRWPIYRKWIDHLFHEFLAQGDLEKVAGLVPAPMMDRLQSCPPQAQIGFINFLVTPLYRVVQEYVPLFKTAVDELAVNIEHLSEWAEHFDKSYCVELKGRADLIPTGAS